MEEKVQAQAESLAVWVKKRMQEREIRFVADLARAAGVSQTSLSTILNPKPVPNTGKYSLPRRETMQALARPLGVSEQESLAAAGYTTQPDEDLATSPFGVLYYKSQQLDPEDKKEIMILIQAAEARIEQIERQKKEKA